MATKQEMINRKRKSSEPQQQEDHLLQLTLSTPFPSTTPPTPITPPPLPPPPPLQEEQEDHDNELQFTLPPPHVVYMDPLGLMPVWNPTPLPTVPPPPPPTMLQQPQQSSLPPPHFFCMTPFGPIPVWYAIPLTTVPPWATTRRATIHSLAHLESRQIFTITGHVQCKICYKRYEIQYDLKEKFNEVGGFIVKNKDTMLGRAPQKWLNPVLPICKFCQEQGNYRVKPVIAEKKRDQLAFSTSGSDDWML
ncbi:pollen-specific leucine-rich repeat extensin-like protein 3 [Cornus florida]|uniref:pollen-specific leucine-rich repeat extensin-like protein 3 n=1 Tax=Cornus florida TaxID=4283 RepID=UPI0028A2149D|nr:pollen-specific leucine-rich repeat extensin-like protein 3 [Cornus florida]